MRDHPTNPKVKGENKKEVMVKVPGTDAIFKVIYVIRDEYYSKKTTYLPWLLSGLNLAVLLAALVERVGTWPVQRLVSKEELNEMKNSIYV